MSNHQHVITVRHGRGMAELFCDGGTRLLEALSQGGFAVRKPCRNGVCGLCRCRLVDGDITYQWRVPYGLWQKDIDAGYILPCIAYPVGNLMIEDVSFEPER